MKTLFFLPGILALLFECTVFWDTKEYLRLKKECNSKKLEDLPWELRTFKTLQILYLLWTTIGLFSSQWFMMLLLLCISSLNKYDKVVWIKIDSAISAFIIIFSIINAFHLHWSFMDIYLYLF